MTKLTEAESFRQAANYAANKTGCTIVWRPDGATRHLDVIATLDGDKRAFLRVLRELGWTCSIDVAG